MGAMTSPLAAAPIVASSITVSTTAAVRAGGVGDGAALAGGEGTLAEATGVLDGPGPGPGGGVGAPEQL